VLSWMTLPRDSAFVPGWVSNVEYGWGEPSLACSLRANATFGRLIVFDKRGDLVDLDCRVGTERLSKL
jgi:hypothetical protein